MFSSALSRVIISVLCILQAIVRNYYPLFVVADQKNSEAYEFIEEIYKKGLI